MTQRVLGPQGSKRRRRFLVVPILLVAVAALFFVVGDQAVHDQTFQLEGDPFASTTTNFGNPPHTQSFDWDSFFNPSGQQSPLLPSATRPGFTNSAFARNFDNNSDGTINTSN